MRSERHASGPHPVRDRGIILTCERGHQQTIYTPDHSEIEARQLAGIMDGTSEFYLYKPRERPIPGSKLAKCGICEAWITGEVFGYGT